MSPEYPNVAMLLNRPDVQTFHSVPNNAAMRVFALADSTGYPGRIMFTPNINHRSFYALMSVREFVTFDNDPGSVLPTGVRAKAVVVNNGERRSDAHHVYMNEDYIPMGFTYDRYIKESVADSLMTTSPKIDMPAVMLEAMVVPDSLCPRIGRVMDLCSLPTVSDIDSLVMARRKCSSQGFRGTTRGFTACMTMPRDNYVFFSVTADKGFKAYVDGKPTDILPVNYGMSAVLVPRGTHNVEFSFMPRGFVAGALISLLSFFVLLAIFVAERKGRGTKPELSYGSGKRV